MAMLWWMGEAEVGMVEGMYKKTTARMVVGEGASDECEVKIGLRQGSVLTREAKTERCEEGRRGGRLE